MEKYKVGVIGATGMVGQRFVTLISAHPWFELSVVAASARSAGKTYEEAVGRRWALDVPMPDCARPLVIRDASDVASVTADVDFVFSAVDMKKEEILALEEEYAAGVRHFISGMARGADLYFAEAVLALKERRPDVLLECARPCESQADRWPEEERARYQSILDRCDYETLVQHRYDRFCMMRRNRYMVDRSARLLAVYDGEPKGGTAQTLAYALRKGLHVTILELE